MKIGTMKDAILHTDSMTEAIAFCQSLGFSLEEIMAALQQIKDKEVEEWD